MPSGGHHKKAKTKKWAGLLMGSDGLSTNQERRRCPNEVMLMRLMR